MADTETYDFAESLTIPLKKDADGKDHYALVTVSLAMNTKDEDYATYQKMEKEIEDYLNTDEPYDKAGAYGIQGKAGLLVKAVNGDYYNVVGLPVARLKREIMLFIENQ